MSDPMLGGNAGIWVQRNGPNTQPVYLGCHGMDDITEPKGGKNYAYCPDPATPNKFNKTVSWRDADGPVTTSIETPLGVVRDYLEEVNCSVPIFINYASCGRPDNFIGWERSLILMDSDIVSKGITNPASRTPDAQGETLQTFDIEARELVRLFSIVGKDKVTIIAPQINDVYFYSREQCANTCGVGVAPCESGVVVSDDSGVNAFGAISTDEGQTWTNWAAFPFATPDNIESVTAFDMGGGVTRILVARNTIGAAAMSVEYTDDGGTTWVVVTVGATVNIGANDSGALFSLDSAHIWLALDGGWLWFSNDGGVTWDSQLAAVLTTNDLHYVKFLDENYGITVGQAGDVFTTDDGGLTWTQQTVPVAAVLNTCEIIDKYKLWVGADNGNIYFSEDGGTTWTVRTFTGSGAGTVNDMAFANEMIGFMVHVDGASDGLLFQTIDGGYSWQSKTTPANDGLNAIHVCNQNLVYAVGDANGGALGSIIKFEE